MTATAAPFYCDRAMTCPHRLPHKHVGYRGHDIVPIRPHPFRHPPDRAQRRVPGLRRIRGGRPAHRCMIHRCDAYPLYGPCTA